MELELLVVILNYKTPKLVIDCLESLKGQLTETRQAVVIDNASPDDSWEQLSAWRDSTAPSFMTFVKSDVNGGFSAGNNIGIKHQAAKHYLLLNSDTIVRDGALEAMLAASKQLPQAGLISPRLEWPDATPQISCFRYHSPVSEMINAAATSVVTKLFRRWDVPIPVQEGRSFPQWTSFACVMIRREVIEQVGLMDEGYFLYFEDTDYCRMARDLGWDIVNVPEARVVHLRGGSSDVKKNIHKRSRLPAYYYASRARYFAKHYGQIGLVFANLLWGVGRIVSLVRALFGKKEAVVCEKQYRDIWINFNRPMKGR